MTVRTRAPAAVHSLLPDDVGYANVVTTTPEQGHERHQREDALESGQVFQDAEGHQTTDPSTAVDNADSEAERNEEALRHGEVGPRIPEE